METAQHTSTTQEQTALNTTIPNITIMVCYHNVASPLLANRSLHPIAVGAQNIAQNTLDTLDKRCKELDSTLLLDNSGHHISHLNPYFCELTAMYWAWKNLDSAYYGLFHYRRILDLSGKVELGTLPTLLKTEQFKQENFGLLASQIAAMVPQYDLIVSNACGTNNDNTSLYEHYANYHYKQDLDSAIAYIKEKYPYMQNALESSLYSKPARWHIANMFVMKKELFFAYCEWIFDVLFAIEKKIDYKQYNPYQARVFGFLAERLFNVWITYKKEQENLKIFYAPIVVFVKKKPFIGWDINSSYKRFYLFGIRVYKGKL